MVSKTNSVRHFATIVLTSCLFFLSPVFTLNAQPIKYIRGGDSIASWAYDSSSGRLFCLDAENGKLCEISVKTGKKIKQHQLEILPESIVLKNGFALIHGSANRGHAVAIFNTKSNTIVKQLSFGAIYSVFTTNDTNDFAYVVSNTVDGTKVNQIDFRKGKKTKELTLRKEIDRAMKTNYVSRMLPGMVRINEYFVQLDERAMRFKKVFHTVRNRQTDYRELRRAIGKRYVESEKGILDADLKKVWGKDEVVLCRMHPKLDLLAAITMDANNEAPLELSFTRFSDRKELVSLKLKPKLSELGRATSSATPTLFEFDDERSLLVVGQGNYSYFVDTSAIVAKATPRLIINLQRNYFGMANRKLAIPIKTLSRSSAASPSYKLEKAPDGFKLENETLVWNPTGKQIGKHQIKLVATDGKILDQMDLTVSILAEHVSFDGMPAVGFTRFGDQWMAVWCSKNRSRGRSITEVPSKTDCIFVVDLAKRQIVSEIRPKESVEKVWIDREHVYFISNAKTTLYRYPIADTKKLQSVFLRGQLTGLEVHLKNYVFANVRTREINRVLAIARDDFKLKPMTGHGISIDASDDELQPKFCQGNLIQVAGRLIDQKAARVHCMLEVGPLPELIMNKNREGRQTHGFSLRDSAEMTVVGKVWGRELVNHQFLDGEQTLVKNIRSLIATISNRYPVGVKLALKRMDNSGEMQPELQYFELQEGRVVKKTPVETLASAESTGFYGIDLVGDQAVVIIGDHLYFSLIEPELRKLKEPLWIHPPRVPPMELGEKESYFQVKTNRQGDDVQFKLKDTVEGITIDPKSGIVTIDGAKLIQKKFHDLRSRVRASNPDARQKQIDELKNAGHFGVSDAKEFENLTGFPLKKGFRGFSLQTQISAVDGTGQVDSWHIAIPVLVKSEFIDRYIQLAKSRGGVIGPEVILPQSLAMDKPRKDLNIECPKEIREEFLRFKNSKANAYKTMTDTIKKQTAEFKKTVQQEFAQFEKSAATKQQKAAVASELDKAVAIRNFVEKTKSTLFEMPGSKATHPMVGKWKFPSGQICDFTDDGWVILRGKKIAIWKQIDSHNFWVVYVHNSYRGAIDKVVKQGSSYKITIKSGRTHKFEKVSK